MGQANPVAARDADAGLVKGLGLTSATTLVMGSMIGSGIYIVSADISRQVQSPGLMMMTWIVTAVLTVIAALSYGELAAAMPHAGGQYVYLREAFGPLYGFLYGWTLFLVIQTGTIAAVAVAFAKFAGIFVPWIARDNRIGPFNTQQLVAIVILILLTAVNTRGVRTGALVQNIFTFAKVAALLALVGFGLALGRNPEAVTRNFSNFWGDATWGWTAIRLVGVAMVGALFSADAWNNVTFTAGEVRNPKRNLPLSLAIGVGTVCLIYIGCNLVYLNVLPLEGIQHAAEDRVATAVTGRMFGPIAVQLMAVGHHGLHLRLHQRDGACRRPRLLRHGARRASSSAPWASWIRCTIRRWSHSSCSAFGPPCWYSAEAITTCSIMLYSQFCFSTF